MLHPELSARLATPFNRQFPSTTRCVRWQLAMLCALLLVSSPGRAAESATSSQGPAVNAECTDKSSTNCPPPAPPAFFSFLDVPQQSISSGIERVARSIDEFFANEPVYYPSSGSYVRYSLQTLFEEGGRHTTVGNLDISLHLPRTEKKLRLIVESDPVEKQSNLERASNTPTSQNAPGYYAGLQTELGKQNKWQFKPSIGLKLHFPLDYYVRLRAFRNVNFDKWNLLLTESAYWFHSTGAGFDSQMQWNHLLNKSLLFRADTLVRHTQEYHRFDLSQIFSLIQSLSERRALTYSIGFFGNSDPHLHATDYILQARYRQIIHGDYLFMELVPQIRYRIDYNFTQEDSLLLRFEWLFKSKH